MPSRKGYDFLFLVQLEQNLRATTQLITHGGSFFTPTLAYPVGITKFFIAERCR